MISIQQSSTLIALKEIIHLNATTYIRFILIENRYLALYDLIIVYFNEIRHNTLYGSIVQKTRDGRRQEHDKQIILHNKVIFIDANDSSFVLQF